MPPRPSPIPVWEQCPRCSLPLPLPHHPHLCPRCLRWDEIHALIRARATHPIPLSWFPVLMPLVAAHLCWSAAPDAQTYAWAKAAARLRAPRPAFCGPRCMERAAEAMNGTNTPVHANPGRCGCCQQPTLPRHEYFLLAFCTRMPHSLPNGTRAIIQIGAVQILATPVAEASAVQQVLLAHDALADWRVFSSPLLAYAVAVHHPTPPPPPPDMVERAFNGGVRVRAVARQREANPTMTVTISAPGHPLWIIHTSARHVGEVDRMLRRLGVRFASIIGPQLWLALGLPPITRQP